MTSLPATSGDAPRLLPPYPRARPAVLGASHAGALGLALVLAHVAPFPGDSGGPPPTILLDASRVPGAVMPADYGLRDVPSHVLTVLLMPEEDKARLRARVREGGVRIGAITLWDAVDEDGDIVRVAAAGFSQDLTLRRAPMTYFIPYAPGGTVRITALKDGDQGGITLALRTALGPLPPLALAPGQSIEVPVL